MQNRPPYRRTNRRGRNAPQSDAIVIALTAQVLVCIILLLAAVIAKKTDGPAYDNVKGQYNAMVAEPAEGESAFAELADLGGGIQEAFNSIERWLTSFIGRFASETEPLPEERSPDAGAQEQPAEPAWEFGYDYLGGEQIAAVGLGMGGRYPVVTGGETTALLPAPEGSTYAAVELAGNLRPPLTGPLTSPFAYREHPLSGEDDFHTGIDIAAAEGRAVLAVLPGEVAEVGESDTYGNFIMLRHAENLQTFYAHCSEIIAAEGMQVRQGERIARVGQTGVATGPHLHFSVLVDGRYTDPYWVLKDNIRPVEE